MSSRIQLWSCGELFPLKQCEKCGVEKERSEFWTYTYGRGNHPECLSCRQVLCGCGCGKMTTGLVDEKTGIPATMLRNHHLRINGHQKKAGDGNKKASSRAKAAEAKIGMKNPMYGQYEKLRKIASQPGKKNPMYGRSSPHGKGSWYTTRTGKKIWLRSRWEVEIAKWLDNRCLTWEYEPRRFDLGLKTYLPDFWIVEFRCYWEVKGWLHQRHQETIRLFREQYPEIPLVVLNKNVMRLIFGGKLRWLK